MNNQEFFNFTLDHLRKQGRPSLLNTGKCAYRGEDGAMCAIGFHIPDEKYLPEMEGFSVRRIMLFYEDVLEHLHGVDIGLIEKMQSVHDLTTRYHKSIFKEEIENKAKGIAYQFNLKYNPPI